jgi:hypothetical protein
MWIAVPIIAIVIALGGDIGIFSVAVGQLTFFGAAAARDLVSRPAT